MWRLQKANSFQRICVRSVTSRWNRHKSYKIPARFPSRFPTSYLAVLRRRKRNLQFLSRTPSKLHHFPPFVLVIVTFVCNSLHLQRDPALILDFFSVTPPKRHYFPAVSDFPNETLYFQSRILFWSVVFSFFSFLFQANPCLFPALR